MLNAPPMAPASWPSGTVPAPWTVRTVMSAVSVTGLRTIRVLSAVSDPRTKLPVPSETVEGVAAPPRLTVRLPPKAAKPPLAVTLTWPTPVPAARTKSPLALPVLAPTSSTPPWRLTRTLARFWTPLVVSLVSRTAPPNAVWAVLPTFQVKLLLASVPATAKA
jgi:hypothetical protein